MWLELGNSDSLNNRNIPFKDAVIISKGGNNSEEYSIITSELVHHDLDKNIIVAKNVLNVLNAIIRK